MEEELVVKAVKLTVKQAGVIEILKEKGDKMFAEDIADKRPELYDKGSKSVSPLMTHLVKNGYVAKEKASREVVNKDGVKVTRELTQYWLTDAGENLEFEIRAEKASA